MVRREGEGRRRERKKKEKNEQMKKQTMLVNVLHVENSNKSEFFSKEFIQTGRECIMYIGLNVT